MRLVELPLHERASLTAEIDSASGRILRAVTRVAGRQTTVSFRRFRLVEGVLFPFAEDLEARDGKRTVIVEQVELVRSGAISIRAVTELCPFPASRMPPDADGFRTARCGRRLVS